jgi:hypothetical protein
MFVHRLLEQINYRNCAEPEALNEQRSGDPTAEEEKVMPALLWVAFWSSLIAAAACFGEMSRAVSIDKVSIDKHDPAQGRDA